MSRDIAEHQGVKYSLQPHGLKSKLLAVFFSFVLAFGGALALASPAQASDPTPTFSPSFGPSPSASPSMNLEPSPSPVPTLTSTPVSRHRPIIAVTVVKTVTATVTITKTVFVVRTRTKVVSQIQIVSKTPSAVSIPTLTSTPSPFAMNLYSESRRDVFMFGWGSIALGIVGGIFTLIGIGVVIRNYRREHSPHYMDDDSEVEMAHVSQECDEYSTMGYNYNLGGRAGDSYAAHIQWMPTAEIPVVQKVNDFSATKIIPPVE